MFVGKVLHPQGAQLLVDFMSCHHESPSGFAITSRHHESPSGFAIPSHHQDSPSRVAIRIRHQKSPSRVGAVRTKVSFCVLDERLVRDDFFTAGAFEAILMIFLCSTFDELRSRRNWFTARI